VIYNFIAHFDAPAFFQTSASYRLNSNRHAHTDHGNVFNRQQFRITPDFPVNLCTGCNDPMVEAGNRAIGTCTFPLKPVALCNQV
jgi:hypothetical protein